MIKIGGLVDQHNLTMYAITSLKDQPGAAAEVLNLFAREKINLEYITEGGCQHDYATLTFCVNSEIAARVDEIIHANIEKHAQTIRKREYVCILGVYGPHFREKPAIAAMFCSALGKEGINILGLSSSISTISAIIDIREHDRARNALLKVFKLP
ncbi:MAG: ACT domain-containing protein [Calditrichaeota bacterium]|nr:ACT domain-containing protein [Calditrichota bacterium]